MDKDEALKMAIEALSQDEGWFEPEAAIKACKEALAQPAQDFFERGKEIAKWADKRNEQPAQEPVAWIKDIGDKGIIDFAMITEEEAYPVYTHPAPSCQECENLKHDIEGYMDANKALINREWQGLSKDEINQEALKDDGAAYFALGAEWANNKLKEKNT